VKPGITIEFYGSTRELGAHSSIMSIITDVARIRDAVAGTEGPVLSPKQRRSWRRLQPRLVRMEMLQSLLPDCFDPFQPKWQENLKNFTVKTTVSRHLLEQKKILKNLKNY
jgi:hypothetical protein